MGLRYENLDETTREFIAKELELDVASEKVYISERLTTEGQEDWQTLLSEAVRLHDDSWLAERLRGGQYIKAYEERRKPKGGVTRVRVRRDAPDMLAEGEFNRFYARGVCARAVAEGAAHVRVYRAKEVGRPRPESEALIDKMIPAQALLEDLRVSIGIETALGIPGGPNSGISVCLPGALQ